ncbi:MAG: hypothetical protein K6E13_09390 [Lachnospiraceae bacterium]|nr:hypothetical protein [Lachnospiraceae bacterium]
MKDQKADKSIVSAMVIGLYETMQHSDWNKESEIKSPDKEIDYSNISEVSSKLESGLDEALLKVRSLADDASELPFEDVKAVLGSVHEEAIHKLTDASILTGGIHRHILEVDKQGTQLTEDISKAMEAANEAGGAVAGIVARLIEAKAGISKSIDELSKSENSESAYRRFTLALAGATGAYSNASDGKEIYDEALAKYEKAGKDGERAKRQYDEAVKGIIDEVDFISTDVTAAKNHVDRLRTAVRMNIEKARREKETFIKTESGNIVTLDDGMKYKLVDESEEVFVCVTENKKNEDGEITDISYRVETSDYDKEKGIYKRYTHGTVTSVAYIGATLTGRDDGYSNIGQAINAAARSATEEASKLDVNDAVNDINIDYMCTATAKGTFITVYTEPVAEDYIENLKKDSIIKKKDRDVVVLRTDKNKNTVTYAFVEEVHSDSVEMGIEVVCNEDDITEIDWNGTGKNIIEAINNKVYNEGGVMVNSSLKVSPKSVGVLGISYLYIPSFTLTANETHDIEIGTKFSDEKVVEKMAKASLDEKVSRLFEEKKAKNPKDSEMMAFESVNFENEASVAYRYDIDYSKFVMLDTEDILISTKTYHMIPMNESVYSTKVVANLLEVSSEIDDFMPYILDVERQAIELRSIVEDVLISSFGNFSMVKFEEVLDKASTNLGVANSLLDAINDKLSDAKRTFDVVFSYEDAVKYMDEVDDEIGELPEERKEKPVSWLWLLIIMIFGETGVKMYREYMEKKNDD